MPNVKIKFSDKEKGEISLKESGRGWYEEPESLGNITADLL